MDWISVDDRLPDNTDMVLIWYSKAGWDDRARYKPGVYLGYYIADICEFRPLGSSGDFIDDISHWMPLPPPPADRDMEQKFKYGCFVNVDENGDERPCNTCVLEYGRPEDCGYAASIEKKEDCKFWRAIRQEDMVQKLEIHEHLTGLGEALFK